MRRGFTLIELLVIVAILATMVTIGVGSLSSGQGAARVKGATRDIFGTIRHARSTALVTGQPAIITYSTVTEDGEVMAKVEITSARLFDSAVDRSNVETLSGEPLKDTAAAAAAPGGAAAGDGAAAGETGGQTIEEILFSPMASEVVKGMRLKVLKGDELADAADSGRRARVSVFSNVDYLIGRFQDAKAAAKKQESEKPGSADAVGGAGDSQESVSVVWETNGRVEPHQIYVYADGQRPEEGLVIRVDRFGAAKVLGGDGRDED